MCFHGMNYLPLLLVVMTAVTFVVTYIWAIADHDVSAYFPYISDTGTKPPESCVFSQLLNMAAALCLCTVFVRYKLVEALTGHIQTSVRRLNKVGLALGVLSAFGMSLVANFQETNIEPVHVTGAFLVFGLGTVYAFIQAGLSYQMYPEFNGLLVCRVRMVISVLALVCLIVTSVSAVISREQKLPGTDKLHWKPDEQGFVAHVVSTVGEWVTAITFLLYFLSFAQEFRKLKLEVVPSLHVRHLDEEPIYVDERTRLLG